MSPGTVTNPFKGLDPYLPGERLFGRDADTLLTIDRVFRGKTTLLFAGSGVGKTSFLRAKVLPDIGQRYREQFLVRYHREWAGKDPLSALKSTLGAPPNVSLADYLRKDSGSATWLVVLDQFEELFQYHVYLEYFDAFRKELAAAITAPDVPARFVVSMREEFLGQLSAFDNRVPDLFANYYRLKNPDRHQVEEIIGMTVETAGVQADEAGLNALIDDLSCIEFRGPGRRMRRFRRDFVILPHLQLVCRRLWEQEEWRASDKEVRYLSGYAKRSRPGRDNPARKALRDFCSGSLEALTPDQQRIAARAFDFLVTSQGAKMPYEVTSLARHMNTPEAQLEAALLKLSDARILKKTEWQTERWYELYHDMYAPVLYEWKEEFDTRLQREEIEESRAAVCDRRAVQAEARENLEEALLLRLKALETRDTDIRRRQAGRLLAGMAALTRVFRHDGPILAMSMRADSRQVVTASGIVTAESAEQDQKPGSRKNGERSLVQVWDWDTGAPTGKPAEVPGTVRAVAINPEGTVVGAITDQAVVLVDPLGIDAMRRAPLGRRGGRWHGAAQLQFAADGRSLLIERRAPTATWGALPLVRRPRLRWPSIRGSLLAFSTSVRVVAILRDQRSLIVLNPSTEETIAGVRTREPITAFALDHDGTRVAVATKDGVVSVWDTVTGKRDERVLRLSGTVRRLAFNEDRISLVQLVGARREWQQGILQTWDLQTGQQVGADLHVAAHRMQAPSFSPKAGFALIRAMARPVAVADTARSVALDMPSGTRISWSADDRFLLAGGSDRIARAWRASALRESPASLTHASGAMSVALCPTSLKIALVAGDGSVSIRTTEGRILRNLPIAATEVVWDRAGKQLALIGEKGSVHVVNVATGELVAQTRARDTDGVFFAGSGKAAVLADTYVSTHWWQWDGDKTRTRTVAATGEFAVSRNGRVFVVFSSVDGAASVWDCNAGERLASLRHEGGIGAVALSPDGRFILSGGEDGRAVLWRSDGTQLAVLPHQGPVVKAAFSDNGRYAATIGADQWLRLWAVAEGTETGRVRYEGSPRALSFTPDGQGLLIASTHWVHLFRVATIAPEASRRLRGRWSGEYRFLERDGSRLLALTATSPMAYQANRIRFDIVESDPLQGDVPLEEWEQRTALRFQGEELTPWAVARAVAPTKPRKRNDAALQADTDAVLQI